VQVTQCVDLPWTTGGWQGWQRNLLPERTPVDPAAGRSLGVGTPLVNVRRRTVAQRRRPAPARRGSGRAGLSAHRAPILWCRQARPRAGPGGDCVEAIVVHPSERTGALPGILWPHGGAPLAPALATDRRPACAPPGRAAPAQARIAHGAHACAAARASARRPAARRAAHGARGIVPARGGLPGGARLRLHPGQLPARARARRRAAAARRRRRSRALRAGALLGTARIACRRSRATSATSTCTTALPRWTPPWQQARARAPHGDPALRTPARAGCGGRQRALPARAARVRAGLVDPARVAALGGSHGGFLTGHLVGQHAGRFRAGIMRNPVLDLSLMTHLTDIPDWCYVEAFGVEVRPRGRGPGMRMRMRARRAERRGAARRRAGGA